jgi:hypothetical protein
MTEQLPLLPSEVTGPTEHGREGAVYSEILPQERISSAEYVDYHMIIDHELDQLSRGEAGVFGSSGFMALGAAIGLFPSAISTWDKLSASPPVAVPRGDISGMICCAGCAAGALVCLVIFGLYKLRNRGLAKRIRARTRRALDSRGGVKEVGSFRANA